MINVIDFRQSAIDGRLPTELPLYLQALWHDGTGNWKTAHDVIDQLTDQRSAHIHAYLHRKEGDIWNADYWYTVCWHHILRAGTIGHKYKYQ